MLSRINEISFLLSALVLVIAVTVFIFLPYLSDLIVAAVAAVLFYPAYVFLVKKMPKWPGLAAAITIFFAVIIIVVPFFFLGVKMTGEARELYARILAGRSDPVQETIQNEITNFVNQFAIDIPEPSFKIAEYVSVIVEWVVKNTGDIFSRVASSVLNLIIIVIGCYYFLRDGDKLIHRLFALSPLSDHDNRLIVDKLQNTIRSVVGGSLVVAVAQGTLTGIGLLIFQVPNAIFWGLVAIMASLVPAVGAMLIIIPATLYVWLVAHNGLLALGLILWGVFIVSTIDNILRPILIERGIKVHSFIILLSVLGGVSLFGPIGFLLGPLVISLLFALLAMYSKLILGKEQDL